MDEIAWFGLSGGAIALGLFPHADLAEDAGLPRAGAGDLPAYQGMTLAMNLESDEAVRRVVGEILTAVRNEGDAAVRRSPTGTEVPIMSSTRGRVRRSSLPTKSATRSGFGLIVR
jgi:hypothetical protein